MFVHQDFSPVLLLLLTVFLHVGLSTQGHAQRVVATIDSAASVIDYTGSATLHDWTGTSRNVSGTLVLDLDAPGDSRALIRAPVASFDSGIEARDENMREVTEADRYPTVTYRTTDIRPTRWGRSSDGHAGRWAVTGDLTFHGETHTVEATVDVRVTDDSAHAHTRFPVSLTRFGVERPGIVWGVAPVADTIRVSARVAGALQEQAAAAKRLDTTRNEVTGTRRIVSTDLRNVPSSRYTGTSAGLQATVRVPSDRAPEWGVTLYGFAEEATGLADAEEVTLQTEGQSLRPDSVTGSTRTLEDGTSVEILEMSLSRSAFETLAEALTASATVGPAHFPLPWRARRDLRLILDATPPNSSGPATSQEGN
jgi:polyisoprenoid-binding protein YceI